MLKKLVALSLFSSIIYAQCPKKEYSKAITVWQKSIHQNQSQKIKLLKEALNICNDLEIAKLDLDIIEASKSLNKQKLMDIKNRNNNLTVTIEQQAHKWNNSKIIFSLWKKFYQKQLDTARGTKNFNPSKIEKIKQNINYINSLFITTGNNMKSLYNIGGLYRADIHFKQNKYNIENTQLVDKIANTMSNILKQRSNVYFGLEGGASSEGSHSYNYELSNKRAKELEKTIISKYPNLKNHIKIFATGESTLVCKQGLLPEKDENGEYRCITKEDKKKSRRVTIRRIQ